MPSSAASDVAPIASCHEEKAPTPTPPTHPPTPTPIRMHFTEPLRCSHARRGNHAKNTRASSLQRPPDKTTCTHLETMFLQKLHNQTPCERFLKWTKNRLMDCVFTPHPPGSAITSAKGKEGNELSHLSNPLFLPNQTSSIINQEGPSDTEQNY